MVDHLTTRRLGNGAHGTPEIRKGTRLPPRAVLSIAALALVECAKPSLRFTPAPMALGVVIPTRDVSGNLIDHRGLIDRLAELVRGTETAVVVRPAYVPAVDTDEYVSIVEFRLTIDRFATILPSFAAYLDALITLHDLGSILVTIGVEAFIVTTKEGD